MSSFNVQCSLFNVQWKFLSLTVLTLFLGQTLNAQEIRVRGKFSTDSIKIGKPVEFHLSAHYPDKLDLLFPDSSFSFLPFELQRKSYVATKTKNGISVDSVTYVLTSYEIDSIQLLKLPVFVVNKSDCTEVFSNTDSIFFQQLVKSIPDSLAPEKLPLKVNVNYLGVQWQLNYILLAIVIGILLVIAVLTWILFGKRIKKYFLLKKLTKGYESFKTQFDRSIDKLNSDFSPQGAEQSLVIWKKYLESLMSRPYTKYTSKEIRQIEKSETLGHSLMAIDRMIYGHRHEDVLSPFTSLQEYVQQQFEKKKEEVANG